MKKLLLFSFLFSSSFSSIAQNCNFDVDTNDPFSGKKTRTITSKVIKGYLMKFNLSDNTYSVELYFEVFGEKNEKISAGDSMLLKLDNNEIISLAASSDAPPTTYFTGTGMGRAVISYFKPKYPVSSEDFQKLAKNLVTYTRIFIGSNPLSNEVDKKNAVKIMNAANCILN